MTELKFKIFDGEDIRIIEKQEYLGFTGIVDQMEGHEKAKWMQYIGLLDDNEEEIYEDDIVEYSGKNYVVVREGHQFNLQHFYESWMDQPHNAFSESIRVKVIGNINIDKDIDIVKEVEW